MKTVFTLRRKLFAFFSNPVFSAVFLLLFLLGCSRASAQENLVGDGFGGRKWYKPANITAGNLSTGTINGQLYMWGSYLAEFITPIPYTASPTYPISGAVDVYGLNPIQAVAHAVTATITPQNFAGGVIGSNNAFITAVNPYAVPGFNNVKLISLAYGHMGALIKSDSTGWIWGESCINGYVSLGGAFWGSDASTAASNVNTPIKVISNAKFVSTGSQHIAFVKYDGTVWTLGDNEFGTYGNGTTVPNYSNKWATGGPNTPVFMSTTPVQMTGITNAVRVAVFGTGYNPNTSYPTGTVILKADGTVWVAGAAPYLRSSSSPNVPTQVPGLSNIVDIKCNASNAMALTSTGDIYVWGVGTSGLAYADGTGIASGPSQGYTYLPKKINFPPPAAPIVAIETHVINGECLAIDENHVLWRWNGGGGNYSSDYIPVIDAKHVADISSGDDLVYITRTNDYPVDERLWQSMHSGGSDELGQVQALNPDYFKVTYNGGTIPGEYEVGKYWKNTYSNAGDGTYYPCHPGAWGLSSMAVIASTSTGNIDCSKTQLTPAPVAGTAAQSDLVVTVNVTALGAFTPTVTGSGFSLEDSSYTLTPTALGTQQFHVPVKYDGATAFSTLMFTVSPATPAAGCTLTLNGKKPAIVNIITADCVPTVGPNLK